jgi:hypothetical protein
MRKPESVEKGEEAMNTKVVIARRESGKGIVRGVLTGSERSCSMEGCTGRRLGVRWPDGKLTWPCTKGMLFEPRKGWQIL